MAKVTIEVPEEVGSALDESIQSLAILVQNAYLKGRADGLTHALKMIRDEAEKRGEK